MNQIIENALLRANSLRTRIEVLESLLEEEHAKLSEVADELRAQRSRLESDLSVETANRYMSDGEGGDTGLLGSTEMHDMYWSLPEFGDETDATQVIEFGEALESVHDLYCAFLREEAQMREEDEMAHFEFVQAEEREAARAEALADKAESTRLREQVHSLVVAELRIFPRVRRMIV